MTITRRSLLMLTAAAAASGSLPALAAGGYPRQPVRLVVPFPPGSVTDIAARVLSPELQDKFGFPFVVENRPGGQTTIGTSHVAKSEPDGHTLLVAALSFVSGPSEFKNLPYDPVKDFDPIALLGTFPLVLMVRSDLPVDSFSEFVAYAKARSAPLSGGYGSSSTRVAVNQLSRQAGLGVTEVSYRGIPNALTDLTGGVIDFTFADLGNALSQSKGGRLKALGVTSKTRSPHAPDWPSLAEVLPSMDITAWLMILAPAGTSASIAQSLSDALGEILADPQVNTRLATAAMTPPAVAFPELKPFVAAEVNRWSSMFSEAGIEPQ